MKRATLMLFLGLAAGMPSLYGQGDVEGSDISSAIPIYFGQTVQDTMDVTVWSGPPN